MRFRVTMNERQAKLVIKALDLYSRLGGGQIEEIERFLRDQLVSGKGIASRLSVKKLMVLREYIGPIKRHVLALRPGESLGITSGEAADWTRECYDVQRVIQNGVAWAEMPEGGSQVWFDDVDRLGSEPLPEFEVVES